jgi:hypothetical protein
VKAIFAFWLHGNAVPAGSLDPSLKGTLIPLSASSAFFLPIMQFFPYDEILDPRVTGYRKSLFGILAA